MIVRVHDHDLRSRGAADIAIHLAFGVRPDPGLLIPAAEQRPELAVAPYQSAHHILRSRFSGRTWCGHCGAVLSVFPNNDAEWTAGRSRFFQAHKTCEPTP